MDFTIEEGMHFLQYVVVDKEDCYLPFLAERTRQSKQDESPLFSIKETNRGIVVVLEKAVVIPKNHSQKFLTGVKVKIKEDSFLLGTIPSEETRFILSNGAIVGDADYYNNPGNEGEYSVSLDNVTGEDITLERGTPVIEFVSVPYHKAENEIIPTEKRVGGVGSTTEQPVEC